MSLVEKFPDVAKLWHPTKNKTLKPEDIKEFSYKEVWWLCPKKCELGKCCHEWISKISDMIKYPNCRFCSGKMFCYHGSLEYKYPELLKLWHPTKNKIIPNEVSPGSDKKVWWICDIGCQHGCDHEWLASIDKITNGRRCPYCAHQKHCIHECLEYKSPDIKKFWHPTKNEELLPSKIAAFSHKKIWCLCPVVCEYGCVHEWEIAPSNFSNGKRCPYCSNHKYCYHQTLEFKCPELLKEWHIDNELKPCAILYSTHQRAKWICKFGHDWYSNIYSRTIQNTNCPKCSRKTQKKLYEWLLLNYNDLEIKTEAYFEWCKSRISDKHYYKFDFLITKLNLIIEIDGGQHFKDVWNWKSADDTREADVFKMNKAFENNYSMVRILQEDVYENKNQWEIKLNSAIRMYQTPIIIFISNNDEYEKHILDINHIAYLKI